MYIPTSALRKRSKGCVGFENSAEHFVGLCRASVTGLVDCLFDWENRPLPLPLRLPCNSRIAQSVACSLAGCPAGCPAGYLAACRGMLRGAVHRYPSSLLLIRLESHFGFSSASVVLQRVVSHEVADGVSTLNDSLTPLLLFPPRPWPPPLLPRLPLSRSSSRKCKFHPTRKSAESLPFQRDTGWQYGAKAFRDVRYDFNSFVTILSLAN